MSSEGFTPALSTNTRLFVTEQPGPAHTPEYIGNARSGAMAWPQGDETPLRIASSEAYGDFVVVGKIRGQAGLPAMPINVRMPLGRSQFFDIVRRRCAVELQTHYGSCKDPSDANLGWSDGKVYKLINARPTNYTTGDQGAFDGDQNAGIMEDIPFTADDVIQILPLLGQEQAASLVTDAIGFISICDSKTCGECGLASDGCQHVFALGTAVAGSPGLPVELQYTKNGGATWATTNVDTLGLAEVPTGMTCVGGYLVITCNVGGALHYAPIVDILAGTETWTKVTTGFVVAGKPNGMFSLSRTKTWIAADAGYVYFSADVTAGVSVQSDGSVTAQNLSKIHGVSAMNLIAIGAANAILQTRNGGISWSAVTGPAVGVVLTACWMLDNYKWLVGTAGGKLFYTLDAGANWTEVAFPGSGSGTVRDLAFGPGGVGFMTHDTGAAGGGRILRSIDWGASWYALPEAAGQILPSFKQGNAIAACEEDPNIAFVGGIGAGTDGIILKLA